MAVDQLSNNSGSENTDLTKDDIFDEINKEDETPDEEDKKDAEDEEDADEERASDSDKEEDEEDGEEKDEDEIKLVDEDEDKTLDDINLVAPFRKADIEKDFPGIFKKYGYLEKSYYRDRAYSQIFATPEEAQEAADSLEELHSTEEALLSGNSSDLIGKIKEHDTKAYNKLIDNYLPNLQKVDPAAHNHVVGGIVKNLISMLAHEAKRTDNDEYRQIALAINKFVFESETFEPHKRLSPDEKEEDKLQDERREFIEEKFESTKEELQGMADEILAATIKANIDPKDLLTAYVKKNAIRDAMEDLRKGLEGDASFRRGLDRLWERAFASNFNRESKKAIKDFYLSKAKTLLKPVLTKARNEALKGIGKRVRETDSDSDTEKTERRPYHKGTRGSTTPIKGGQKKADIPRGMTTLDFLNKD